MPDVDVIERSLTRPWRAAYRLIKGKQPVEIVSAEVLGALAAQLRSDGGMPALAEASEAAAKATHSGEKGSSFYEVVREIERRFSHSGTAKGTADAARRLVTRIEVGQALPGPISLAEEHCWGLIDRHLFGRLNRFVGIKNIPSFEALSRVRADCRLVLDPKIRQLARTLAADPLASHLRAPAFSRKRPITSELLEEPL